MTNSVPELPLSDSAAIPQLGFGVFQVPPQDTAEAVRQALATGYRHVDTAAMYRNEPGVGDAVRSSGLARRELFVTTKLWNGDQGRDSALRALQHSLGQLQLDYVDLYLIHWPVPSRDRYVETWQTLSELPADGRARCVGVSNFQVAHLERIIEETGVVPAVNQIELHPSLQQAELRDFHRRHGIVTEAWSPLGQGAALKDPTIAEIADELGRTPAQVVLRWHIEHGIAVIPKSSRPERIAANFDVLSFWLTPDEVAQIDRLSRR